MDWIERFGAQSGRDVDKFADLDMTLSPNGNPILSNALGWLECSVETSMNTGDRTVYLGQIIDGRLMSEEPPLSVKYLYDHAPTDLIALLNGRYSKDAVIDLINIQQWHPDSDQPA